MKTAKIESYRFDFVSYHFAMELIGIESNRYYALYLAILRRKKKEKQGFNYFSFPYNYTICHGITVFTYLYASQYMFPLKKTLHYPHFSHRFNVFAK